MTKLRVLDLFSGIGGFSLGLERTGGFETVAFCEIEEYPRKVLKKHWPEVPCYEDVRNLTAKTLARDGIAVDVITGGFPCQDLSVAGKQEGIDAERSGLWSEIVRLIGEIRPRYVIVENVANLLRGPSEKPGGWFGRVLGDLAKCGYDAEWRNIPAGLLGARHLRTRIWLVAYPNKVRRLAREIFPPKHAQKHHRSWASDSIERIIDLGKRGQFSLPSDLCVDDVVSTPLGGYGNAVVPQIPEMLGHAILQAEAEA
jgi:DNA (cytosine-5)-methyltransferase 1